MSSLHNLWIDLVDKRLWPVAAGLVALLIAIPVLLSKPAPKPSASATPAAGGAVAVPAPPGGTALIADVSGTPYTGPVKGASKDPFKPRRLPTAAADAGSGSGGAAGGAAGATGGGGGSTGGGGATGGGQGGGGQGGGGTRTGGGGDAGEPAGPATPTPTPGLPGAEPDVVASLQFGLIGGEAVEREVAELTPLPSVTSPVVVYLGQSKTGEAAFLVSSDVTPSGTGRCLPSKEVCSTLYLKPGQVAFLGVATSAGREVRYRLKFVRAIG